MEEVLGELETLSLDAIRQELVNRGEQVGPAMPSMRHLFEKILARRIMRERGMKPDDEDTPPSVPEVTVTKTDEKPTDAEVNRESDQFFALSLPQDLKGCQDQLVFTDKKEAMKAMKNIPGCRFKIFKDLDNANAFTTVWAEDIVASPRPQQAVESKIPERKEAEKRSFREPTRADRIKLKCAVETGDLHGVGRLAWSNPHYLMSIGETPVVLHEAFRYNALHLAAKYNQPEVCQVILNMLSDSMFHQNLYPEEPETTRDNRVRHLLDLYLNTPDRGGGESALHFACKYGHPYVVEVLIKYPQCDRTLKNKSGAMPYDVINQRATNPEEKVAEKIRNMLKGLVYVPLYRVTGSLPVIGQPVSEAELKDKTLQAYAGPMTPDKAERFYRSWAVFPPNSPQQKQKEIRQTKRSDYDKGLERLGRGLAAEFDVHWNEYWVFCHKFTDLRTPEGLQLLEMCLKRKAQAMIHEDWNGNDIQKIGGTGDSLYDFKPRKISPILSPVQPESPGEMTLLAQQFSELKLNDSSQSPSPKKTLSYDSDSDADSDTGDSFKSAPTSPIRTKNADDSGESHDDGDDQFEDAVEEVQPSFASLNINMKTPVSKLLSREVGVSGYRRVDCFLDGRVPTKLDLDVLRAVGDVAVKVDAYPYFVDWRFAVSSFSAHEQNQWLSPARVRRMNTPQRDSPYTMTRSTPKKQDLSGLKSKLEF